MRNPFTAATSPVRNMKINFSRYTNLRVARTIAASQVVGLLGSVVLVQFCCISARADVTAVPNSVHSASSGLSVDPAYTVAPEDVLYVNVVNFSNLSTSAAVTPDGDVSLPLIGEVHVEGMTIGQIDQLLTQKLEYFVKDPSVATSLTDMHKQTVSVTGFVLRPGETDFEPPMRVLDALADVGGPLTNGNLDAVTVTTKSLDKTVLDLSKPETKVDSPENIVLAPGDTIYVPENREEITVDGEVSRPGTVVYKDDMTVSDALTIAGPVLDDADLGDSTLTHDGVAQPLDLEAMLHHQDMSANVTLSPGDRILVPQIQRTYVYGDVNRPGSYSYKPGDRILDALNAAAGPGPSAKLSEINLVRISKDKNKATVQQVNLDKFLKKGDTSENVALEPGDVIFIPTVRHVFSMNDMLVALNGVNLLNTGAYIANHGLGH
jgi:polysaccharide biosynthesis/export protein